MDPRDERFVNRYRYSDEKYIETVRLRHDIDTDVWLCDFDGRNKKYILTVNTKKDVDWMERVTEEIEAIA